jgi:arylsulfatase
MAAQWDAWAKRANVLPWPWDKESGNHASGKSHFDLAADAELGKAQAPDYVGRGFTVSVHLAESGSDGVLVAQGGSQHAWALFFQKGTLHFVITRAGEREDFAAPAEWKDAKNITATLAADRTLTLLANGRELLRKTAGEFPQTLPAEGLQVGCDRRGTVGDYQGPFTFAGKIQNATVDLLPR